MATYRVKWEELSPGAKYPAHKATTVSASSMAEAREGAAEDHDEREGHECDGGQDFVGCESVAGRRTGGVADNEADEAAALQDAGDAQAAEGLCASLRFGDFPAGAASFPRSRFVAILHLYAAALGGHVAARARAVHAKA